MRCALLTFFTPLALLAVALSREAEREPARPAEGEKLRVAVVGAHPDDPESGCGGMIALLAKQGHEVVVGYLTCFRGNRKVGQEPEALVRKREATAACQILGTKPH